MIERYVSSTAVLRHLRCSPLCAHVEGFAELLFKQGYALTTATTKLLLLSELSQWIERRSLAIEDLDECRLNTFLGYRKKKNKFQRGDSATVRQFLGFLTDAGIVPASVSEIEDSPIQRIETRFAQYLSQERGLSPATLANYLPTCHWFLTERFRDTRVAFRELCPHDISSFILRHAHAVSTRRVQLLASALRSFFRFLYKETETSTNLASAVPTVKRWRFTGLPKFLQPEEVQRLLHSCDQSTAIGKRDYAILLLLARLGLRAGEIVHMSLDDIHWEAGELVVRGKSSREERLPMAQDVGEALAVYLRGSRPRCSSRRVFMRMKAPREGFSGSAAVCDIVRRALSRAGINPSFKGAHLLRHTLATTMLRDGASFTEIGEILRHQLPNTTEIYAKVDLAALRSIAQPWPEEEALP